MLRGNRFRFSRRHHETVEKYMVKLVCVFIYLRWDGLAPDHMLKEEKLDTGGKWEMVQIIHAGDGIGGVLNTEVVYLLSPPSPPTLER